jgi:hypothetical protein
VHPQFRRNTPPPCVPGDFNKNFSVEYALSNQLCSTSFDRAEARSKPSTSIGTKLSDFAFPLATRGLPFRPNVALRTAARLDLRNQEPFVCGSQEWEVAKTPYITAEKRTKKTDGAQWRPSRGTLFSLLYTNYLSGGSTRSAWSVRQWNDSELWSFV